MRIFHRPIAAIGKFLYRNLMKIRCFLPVSASFEHKKAYLGGFAWIRSNILSLIPNPIIIHNCFEPVLTC